MRKSIKKVGIYCGALLLGVSGYALLRHVATENAPEFNRTKVTVNKDKMSIQDFYSGLQMGDAGWYFIDKDGKPHNVDSLCDSRHRENALHGHYKHVKLKEKIDTVYVRYSGWFVYFWTNENDEPIHFHIAEGRPSELCAAP